MSDRDTAAVPPLCSTWLHLALCANRCTQILKPYDAIFLGAVGFPSRYPDHITLEPLIRMRQAFDQFACVRPARTYPGVPTPLAANPTVDMIVVRENSEGEYVNNGGRFSQGQPNEVAIQSAVHTRKGVERVLRHGFELAMRPERRQKTDDGHKKQRTAVRDGAVGRCA